MTGTVVFSLDFELGWGHADIRPEYVRRLREEANDNFQRIRSLIDLFDKYQIPATWAIVGKLTEAGDDPLFYNPDLFEYLLNAEVDHEIGLHSYEHPDFSSLSEREAEVDLEAGIKALSDWEINPESFIFPRDRIAHIELLGEYNFRYYRSKTTRSKFQSLLQELVPPVAAFSPAEDTPHPIPATQYLAARRPETLIRLNMKRSLKRVVAKDGLVHFWLHPHEIYTRSSLFDTVEKCIELIGRYAEHGDISCTTMMEIQ